jgi:hypothetical protein
MNRALSIVLLLIVLVTPAAAHAQATDDGIQLRVAKSFGFQAGGRLQGTFNLTVEGRDDLVEVSFLVDGETVAVVKAPPFEHVLRTGDFSLGSHVLSAVAITADGAELATPPREYEFVSADEGFKSALTIVGPILGLVLLLTLVGVLGPVLLSRRGGGFVLGKYGVEGGAVCPHCRLPYPRHFFSPNLVVGKLERCPHCGRWSIAARASAADLRAAEARYVEDSQQGALSDSEGAQEDVHRRRIEETRYES